MVIIIICLAIFLCLVSDCIITRCYCTFEKKRAYARKAPIAGHVSSTSRTESINRKLVHRIKRCFDGWVRYKLRRLGLLPSHHVRNVILKKIYLMDIQRNAVIYGGFEIRAPWNISIGEGSIIGDESKLDGRNGIVIGKNVNLSTGVWIWTEQHDLNDSMFGVGNKGGTVTIGDRAWISARTILLPKVSVKQGAVVAAGAVVTTNCEEYCIYGGIPAKKIGERNRDLRYEFDGSFLPFY